jgi:putative acetyltransferase
MTSQTSQDFRITADCAAYAAGIAEVTRAAFTKEYGSGDGEIALTAALRADGGVAVELAALHGDVVVGHAMFSTLMVSPPDLRVAALAPASAAIDRQRSGIGSALIREGLARLKAQGFDVVTVLGDPKYYQRFGFTLEAARVFDCKYAGEHFQAVWLNARHTGSWQITYPPPFESV